MANTDIKSRPDRKAGRTYPLLSPREVEALIAEGRSLIIVDQHVLKVDAWLPYHPGGDKAIQHMIGRDATDEVNGLHSAEARAMMDRYRIGRIEGRWQNMLPPIQGGTFRPRTVDDEDEKSPFSSSSGSSRAPSPSEKDVRQRRPATASPPSANTLPPDGLAHLDALTKQEIILDLSRYPALDAATQSAIIATYRLLHARIQSEGLFDCNYRAYAIECTRYALLFTLSLTFLRLKWFATSAFFLGAFWHQLVFTAHDAGHMGITHSFQVDTAIGIFVADFLGGLSLGWWKRSHNVHHIVTNAPEHDPDIEHLPFFAVSHRLLGGLRSTYYERVMEYNAAAKFFVGLQAYLYHFILLFGRFNLYRLSWEYILLGLGPRKGPAAWHRWLELAGQVFFWTWFGYGVLYCSVDTNWHRFVYVLVSHVVTAPLHLQITLSHFAMSTADLGVDESFPQRMLRTTMDVDCPEWLDWFHGGLQFQAIHHLYPRLPRHNLRRTQRLVQGFCDEVGIPYALYGFVDGNKEVLGRLGEVARQAAILKKCQGAVMGELGGGH